MVYTAARIGRYRFTYVGRAYSVYPLGQSGPNGRPWRTAVFVYRGGAVPFIGEIIDKDKAQLRIADTTDTASRDEALMMAQGTSWFEIDLGEGETITLVAVDGRFSLR